MFAFSLAEALGMTVGELGQRMSVRELSEWMVYSRIKQEQFDERTRKAKAAQGAEVNARKALRR